MARYWRMTAIMTWSGTLELSEAQLYEGGAPVSVVPTASVAPTSGNLSDLVDGLASSNVTWTGSMPTLVWDTAGLAAPFPRLGSGTSDETFPVDFIFQGSDDGVNWTTRRTVDSLLYPGAQTLSMLPTAIPADTSAASVALFLDGALTDSGPNSVVLGSVGVSPTLTNWAGIPCLAFNGAGSLTVPVSSGIATLPGDFTVEAWVWLATQQTAQTVIDARTNGGTAASFALGLGWSAGGGYMQNFFDGSSRDASALTPIGTWRRIVWRRSGSTFDYFDGDVNTKSFTYSGTIAGSTTNPVYIGSKDPSNYVLNGYLAKLRFTKGVARSTSDFLPLQYDFKQGTRKYKTSALARAVSALPGAFLPGLESVGTHPQAFTYLDAYYGGQYKITGTVKEKSSPSNKPLKRRVVLVDERSRLTVAETWSDAAGNYRFYGIRGDLAYTVISYDYSGTYRAVIADNVTPELIV